MTTGRLPNRRKGVNPDLPVDGRGKFEWRGFLKASKHPQDVSPSNGLLVNWNNKPAKDFPAGDERWDEGGTQRVDWLLAELAKRPKHTPASVLGAANAGATADPRGLMWPAIKAVLDRGHVAEPARHRGRGPDHGVVGRRRELGRREPRRLHRRARAGGDGVGLAAARHGGDVRPARRGRLRGAAHAAVAVPVAARAACTAAGTSTSRRTCGRCSGSPCKGKFKVRYCGRGNVERCAEDLWAAIEAGATEAAATQGQDPATWRTPTVKISFSPLPLVDMQYTNRPSGIHQVMQFAP